MIEVSNLFHSYKKNEDYAVNDISFRIEKGEIFGFLGPSGAGKSKPRESFPVCWNYRKAIS
ncbi:MAG: ATP-binding cassette domain-containing protein [Candidatus Neomarinimicrobiota bacterium]